MEQTNNEPGGTTTPPVPTAEGSIHDAAMAAFGRHYAANEAEEAAFSALVERNLRALGVMASATIPGDIPSPPGSPAPGEG